MTALNFLRWDVVKYTKRTDTKKNIITVGRQNSSVFRQANTKVKVLKC